MNHIQFRLLWNSISTSKKIKSIQGDRWFRIGCHLVYTWLLPWGDDEGRLRGEPVYILANILPNEGLSISDIEKILTELHRVELIIYYEIDNEYFIQVVDWNNHQRIRKDRYKTSHYPCPPNVNQMSTTGCQNVSLSPSPSPSPSPSSKPKKEKTFTPPSLDEVKEFFLKKGYDVKIADKAFDYYSAAEWKDSRGKPVMSWKQKMIAVWMKDEYRLPVIQKEKSVEELISLGFI